MKWKRASRVRIAIKREALLVDSVESEAPPPPQQQQQQKQRKALYKRLKEKSENSHSLNIKKEDTKNEALIKLKLKYAPGMLDAADTTDLLEDAYIKQEDMAKKESLVDTTSSKGFVYRCSICKMKFSDYQSAMHHRTSIHYYKTIRSIKHTQLEPDYNDPNNACQSCEFTYSSKSAYVAHLKNVHYMYPERKWVGPLHGEDPNPCDPNFHCLSCKKTYSNKYSHRTHLKQTHDIIVPPIHRKDIKNTDVLPDWNDPTYYCPSCERRYTSKRYYTKHCRNVHNMTSPNKQQYNERELPDLHDPNYYCKICGIKHKNEQSYRSHCYNVHGMRIIISNASDQNTNLYNKCSICDKSFTIRHSLNKHLFIFHKMDNDSPPKSRNEKPDINDPNNYCQVCEKTYATKNTYKYHLLSMHRIKEKGHGKEESRPDVDDPNNYCRVCQRTYTSRSSYRMHLARIHQVMLPKRAAAYDPNHFPDPHDPNWHCCVCKTYSKSRYAYRDHCRKTHRMKIDPLNKFNVNPNAEININDPNFYCAKCDKNMTTRHAFMQHLRRIHRMTPASFRLKDPNASIDPNDANLYCAQCKRCYSNKFHFKQHLTRIHQIR